MIAQSLLPESHDGEWTPSVYEPVSVHVDGGLHLSGGDGSSGTCLHWPPSSVITGSPISFLHTHLLLPTEIKPKQR